MVSAPNIRTAQVASKSLVSNSDEKESLSVVYVTASSIAEAKTLAAGLFERGLVACINLIPQITSMYIWEGKMEESSEVMMMMKVSEKRVILNGCR